MKSFSAGLGDVHRVLEARETGRWEDKRFVPSAPPHPQVSARDALRAYPANVNIPSSTPLKLVVIGTSLGGLQSLQILLPTFPTSFPLPVAIVQHRHSDSNDSLSVFLQQYCLLPLTEPEDKEVIRPGQVYLAPPDYHLLVETGHFALSTEAPVSYARPSINVLFESAADAYKQSVIGVILTGASDDGSQGILSIKKRGGLAIIQEPTTAECPTMPKAAITALQKYRPKRPFSSYWILPLHEIAPFIVNLCQLALR